MIFRTTTRVHTILCEFIPDETEYTVDEGGGTIRYASEKSGIVVEVAGGSIVIRSTAEVPRDE